MSEIISVAFRLINFGIFTLLGIIVFRKYAVIPLREQKAADEMDKANLEKQKRDLGAYAYELDAHIAQQEVKGQYLIKKMHVWQEAVLKQQETQDKERERLIHQLNDVIERQHEQLHNDRVKKLVLPSVIAKARTELAQWYSESERAHHVVEKVVDQLPEKVING